MREIRAMTFDARKISISDEPFPFIGLDGETYELLNIRAMTGWQAERLNAGDLNALVQEKILTQEAYEAIMAMPVGVQEQLANEWVEYGGSQGKAGTPSSPTRKGGTRSKQT